jgi:aryl-alcohol dehydrogenase-like predicted oxidoreductase
MSEIAKPAAAAGTLRLGDLTVNRMAFGAMRIAGPDIWGDPRDRPAARKLLVRAFELGHNFFDTADSYGPEVSENIIAEALHPYPTELVIGTKGGLVRPLACGITARRQDPARRRLQRDCETVERGVPHRSRRFRAERIQHRAPGR